MRITIFFVTLIFEIFTLSVGLIHNLHVSGDSRPLFKIETFGFEQGGVIDITIKDFKVSNYRVSERAGFVMRSGKSESSSQADIEKLLEKGDCIFDVLGSKDFSLELVQEDGDWKSYHKTITINDGEEGLYSLVYARCSPGLTRKSSFKLQASFYNPEHNYLSAGDKPLPIVYFLFLVLFIAASGAWIYVLKRPSSERGPVHAIHYLMLVVLALKVACLFCEAVRWRMISFNGAPGFWSVLYYILSTLKGIMLFTVIMLIGSGWSLIKSNLNDKEKRIILIVLTLQVFDNIAMVVLEETAPGSQGWLTWRDLLHLVDIICCCAILFPIIWSIKKLRDESADNRAQRSIQKLQLFRTFYVTVVLYIYFTRIIVFLVSAVIPFNLLWLSVFITELGTLAFYVFTGYKFMPTANAIYMPLGTAEDESEDMDYGLDKALSDRGEAGDIELQSRALLPGN